MRRTLSPLACSIALAALSICFGAGCGDLTQPNYNQLQIQKDPDVKAATASVPGAAAPGANANQAAQAQGGAVRAPAAEKAPAAAPPAATGLPPMQKLGPTKPVVAPQPQMPSGPSCGG